MSTEDILLSGIGICLGAFFLTRPFLAAARYGLLKKAGLAGWRGLIPFYGEYLQYKISWKTDWYWFHLLSVGGRFMCYVLFAGAVITRTDAYTTHAELMGALLISLPDVIIALWGLCVRYLAMEHLSETFGRGKNFALGLYFLSPIFMLYLGFNRNIYEKSKKETLLEETE